MDYKNIIFDVAETVAVLKFNRPKALNAVNPDIFKEMDNALDRIEGDGSIRVLILTGEGDKAFVAGADITHMIGLNPLQAKEFSRNGQDLLFRLGKLPIPVIACVNGFALGGGCEIAMACDFIYASENAKFGQPEINLGLIPGFAGTQRLSRLAGKAIAKEICMTGGMINAQEAKQIGFVNKVFPQDELWEATMKTANLIAKKGKVALKAIKECIDRGFDVDLMDGCYMESEAFGLIFTSPDSKEGMSAFLEKREPEFEGDQI
jgi:enoyl-CoA hydratase